MLMGATEVPVLFLLRMSMLILGVNTDSPRTYHGLIYSLSRTIPEAVSKISQQDNELS